MRAVKIVCILLAAAFLFVDSGALMAQRKKDYLSGIEADKIRDAETTAERIKLFLAFAADRIKKFQFELSRTGNDRQHIERLNGLLNAYAGCVDDAAALVDAGRGKQEDIRPGIKEMQARAREFLNYLEGLTKNGPELESYKANLDDAVEATHDALEEAQKAAKEIAPPPVRRKN